MNKIKRNQYLFAIAALTFILIYCFAVYSPSLHSYFIADDHLWRRVTSLEESLSFFWSNWGHGLAYRPLARISFSINAWFSQEPFYWHIVNISIHAVNCFLVYIIIVQLGRSQKYLNKSIGSWLPIIAFCIAILFASSASSYQNVTWISARTHSLAALFFLLAFYSQLYHSALSKCLTVFFFIASMMCYESMAIFPFFIIAINFTHNLFNGDQFKEALTNLLSQWRFYLILFITLILFLIYRYHVLDIYTVRVVGFATSPWRPLENLARYFGIGMLFNKWLNVSLIIIALVIFKHKKLLLPTSTLWISVLIIIAPYLPSDAVAYRYTYLFILFCTVICGLYLAASLINFKQYLGKALLILILIAAVIHNTGKLGKFVDRNARSAELAEDIISQSSKLIIKLPKKGQLFFAGIPVSKNGGAVHITYFDYALKTHLKQEKNKSQIFWDFSLSFRPEFFNLADKNDTFFLFKESKLVQVDFNTWRKSNEVSNIKKGISN